MFHRVDLFTDKMSAMAGCFVGLARVLEMFHRVDLFTDKMSTMAGCLEDSATAVFYIMMAAAAELTHTNEEEQLEITAQ